MKPLVLSVGLLFLFLFACFRLLLVYSVCTLCAFNIFALFTYQKKKKEEKKNSSSP